MTRQNTGSSAAVAIPYVLAYRVVLVSDSGQHAIESWSADTAESCRDELYERLSAGGGIGAAIIQNNAHGGEAEPRHHVAQISFGATALEFNLAKARIAEYEREHPAWGSRPEPSQVAAYVDAESKRDAAFECIANAIEKAMHEYESKPSVCERVESRPSAGETKEA